MTTKPERDLVATMVYEINGHCGPHIRAGINGNLPEGWRVAHLSAKATHGSPQIAVFADAWCGGYSRAGSFHELTVGVKMMVDTTIDHLKLADEVARQICEKINRRNSKPTKLRIALEPGAIMPTRGSAGASGYDLYAPTDVMIRRGATVVIHSGVRIELPDDTWEAQIRPRSSMSKRGMVVPVGTVDSDYRGVVGATVTNLSSDDQVVRRGERFAQMVLARICHPEIEQVEVAELTPTERGDGSLGSTGS